jgi:hypothetical protein
VEHGRHHPAHGGYRGLTPGPSFTKIAKQKNAGSGTQTFQTTSSASGRYVLIWFTRLPADGHGHYQVSVYDVAVDGVSR